MQTINKRSGVVTSRFQEYAKPLLADGFLPVPITEGSKRVVEKGWTGYLDQGLPDDVLEGWMQKYNSGSGIGIATGAREDESGVIGLDLDFLDREVTKGLIELAREMFGDAPIRVGKRPKALMVYTTADLFGKITTPYYVRSDEPDKTDKSKRSRIEILSRGQQFVAYHTHPDTGKEYYYLGKGDDRDLLGWGYDFLEGVTHDGLLAYIEKAEELILNSGFEVWQGSRGMDGSSGGSMKVLEDDDLADVDFMFEDKEKVLDALTHISSEDYDVWIQIGQALHSTKAGQEAFEVWDRWSYEAANYDAEIMADKWKSFHHLKEGGVSIGTLYHFARENGWEGWEVALEEAGEVVDGINCATPSSADDYRERYWFMETGSRVVDLCRPCNLAVLPWKDFKLAHSNNYYLERGARGGTRKVEYAVEWVQSADRRTLIGETYYPKGEKVIDKGGMTFFNVYEGSGIVPELGVDKDDPRLSVLWAHMDYLFDNEEDRELFMDWLAFSIQHPERKLPWAMLLLSRHHGVGKGFFAEFLSLMLGAHNVTTCSAQQLAGEGTAFNEYMHHAVLTIVHEIKGGRKFEVTDYIKNIITETRQHVNVKFGGQRTEAVFNNMFFMSNHPDALAIKADDRRIQVIESSAEARNAEYYRGLFDWLDDMDCMRAALGYMVERDLSGFSFNERPRMSSAKIGMIEANMSIHEEQIRAGIDFGEGIFAADIVDFKDVKAYIEAEVYSGRKVLDTGRISELAHILDEITGSFNFKNLKGKRLSDRRRIKFHGAPVTVRCVRNFDKWENADTTEIREELEKSKSEGLGEDFGDDL